MESHSPYQFRSKRYEYRIKEVEGTKLIDYYGHLQPVVIDIFLYGQEGFFYDALNAKGEERILAFCNRYGRLGLGIYNHLEPVNLTGMDFVLAWIHRDMQKKTIGVDVHKYLKGEREPNPYMHDDSINPQVEELEYEALCDSPELERLDNYKIALTLFQAVVQLKSELDNHNLPELLRLLIFLTCHIWGADDSEEDSFLRSNLFAVMGVPINRICEGFVPTGNTGDINCTIDCITGEMSFAFDFDLALESARKYEKQIYQNARQRLALILNQYIRTVRQEIQFQSDGAAKAFLRFDALYDALYYCFFLKVMDGKIIRKCKSRTCDNFFEIIGNDTRKLYCSVYCAKSEQKRMERARQKKERDADGDHRKKRKSL